MTIEINAQDRHVVVGTFGSVESLSQSTATIAQNISLMHAVTQLTGGTATGFGVNIFHLQASGTGTATGPLGGPAAEGMEKYIYMLGTGEAKIQVESWATVRTGIPEVATATVSTPQSLFTAASATGALVLSLKGQWVKMLYINKQWHAVSGVATYATAT